MYRPISLPLRRPWLTLWALTTAVLAGCASALPQVPPLAALPITSTLPAEEADTEGALQQDFTRWVDSFQATARAAGISETTLHAAFDRVHYLPRVVALDRAQPEFTRTVWDYLDTTVSPQRVTQGQHKLLQIRADADAAATCYGVPATILVAIWGMESNYGGNYGNTSTIDALATLGFEGRREDWAQGQLLAALKILQNGDIDRAHMVGSWAGAMGQTQFLPSNFLADRKSVV